MLYLGNYLCCQGEPSKVSVNKETKKNKNMHNAKLYSTLMSIIFHHFSQLTECIEHVEQIEDRVIKH